MVARRPDKISHHDRNWAEHSKKHPINEHESDDSPTEKSLDIWGEKEGVNA
jgi:hypothetical protein